MSNPALCVHCRNQLPRPGARFCPVCGREQTTPAQPTVSFGATLQIQEDGQIRTLTLTSAKLTMGRAPDNDVQLNSRFVSGHHARIESSNQTHRIVDVGSTNGLLFAG